MSVNITLNTDYTVVIYPYAVQSTGDLNTGFDVPARDPSDEIANASS